MSSRKDRRINAVYVYSSHFTRFRARLHCCRVGGQLLATPSEAKSGTPDCCLGNQPAGGGMGLVEVDISLCTAWSKRITGLPRHLPTSPPDARDRSFARLSQRATLVKRRSTVLRRWHRRCMDVGKILGVHAAPGIAHLHGPHFIGSDSSPPSPPVPSVLHWLRPVG